MDAIAWALAISLIVCVIGESVLINERLRGIMGLVRIDQDDLDGFAAAISESATAITEAADVLGQYMQQLLAGQAEPLADADETAVRDALSKLSSGTATLNALEPPTAPGVPGATGTPIDLGDNAPADPNPNPDTGLAAPSS